MVDEASGEFSGSGSLSKDTESPETTITLEYGSTPQASITLKEGLRPFLGHTLKDGGILEWKRTDLSRIGEIVKYMDADGEFEEEYAIEEWAGTAILGVEGEEGKKVGICDSFEISQDLQGEGLGSRLWKERVEPKAKEYQVKEMRVTHVMAGATGFWRKMGYEPLGGNENSRTWTKNLE